MLLDPAERTARILDGTPAEHADRPWYTLLTVRGRGSGGTLER
ncbi:hypothetical protein [Streptomyces sp. NPDC093105]